MPNFRSQSIILRGYDFSEADRVMVVFTSQWGKLRAVAKGIRRLQSRLASALGLLSLSELQFYGREHQELFIVTQGQLQTAFPRLKADLKALGQAARMAELVERLTPDRQPLPEIFKLLQEGLELLEAGASLPVAGLWFEMSFLDKMGYRPAFQTCRQCGKDSEEMVYVPERGGVVCRGCDGAGQLRISRGGRTLLLKLAALDKEQLRKIRVDQTMARQVQAVLSAALEYQIGYPLRSDKFRQAVNSLETTPSSCK